MKPHRYIAILLIAVSLSGCGKPTAPTNAEVLNYLNSQIPAGNPVEFTAVECGNYPQGDGQCRVKVKATVRCKSELYQVVDLPTAIKRVAGWDMTVYKNALLDAGTLDEPYKSDLVGKVSSFTVPLTKIALGEVSTPAGKEATVYGTLEANRQVDTWSFSTDELQRGGFPGQTADQIQGKRLVAIDSDEAKQLLTQEAKAEQDFVAAEKDAAAQVATARQAAAQVVAAKHAEMVKALLAATGANKSYVGTIVYASDGPRLVFSSGF